MRTEMGENVQEVVSRWLFEEEDVHTQTSQDLFCASSGSLGLWNHDEARVYVVEQKNWLDKRFTTRCSVPSALRMFARVTKLWQATYKKWMAKERERVTESFWESAVSAGLGLCRRTAYEQYPPSSTGLGHRLVFEGDRASPSRDKGTTQLYYILRPVVSVVFVRHGIGKQHPLAVQVTKGHNATVP